MHDAAVGQTSEVITASTCIGILCELVADRISLGIKALRARQIGECILPRDEKAAIGQINHA